MLVSEAPMLPGGGNQLTLTHLNFNRNFSGNPYHGTCPQTHVSAAYAAKNLTVSSHFQGSWHYRLHTWCHHRCVAASQSQRDSHSWWCREQSQCWYHNCFHTYLTTDRIDPKSQTIIKTQQRSSYLTMSCRDWKVNLNILALDIIRVILFQFCHDSWTG